MQTESRIPLRYQQAKRLVTVGFAGLWLLAASGLAHAADVSVQINVPGPVIALPAPPHMVWLPSPHVYIAFGSPHQIFFDDDNYYLYDHDVWYIGPGYGGPWARTQVNRLPPGLRKHRHEHWDDYQRQAQPRYRADDDHNHRNFVGWKEKKEKQEKYNKPKHDDRGRRNERGRNDDHDRGNKNQRGDR
jgi:hypothetical protein